MPVHPYFLGGGNGASGDGAVTSVNGEQGDVVLTAQDLQAQPASSVLTDIASIAMPDNSFLHTDSSGNFTPSLCMPAGVAWLGYTTVDQQKAHLAYATVATTGSYSDLTDKPSVPTAQVNSDWNATSGVSQVLNKPTLFSGSYADLTGKPVLFSGNYADLFGKPTLFDGTYTSLTGKPTSFPPSAHTHAISDVTGLQAALDSKVSTGSSIPYSVLTGTPTIPAAQVQSDWNQVNTSALDFIKNKPIIPSVNYPVTSVNTKTGAVVLTNTDVGAAATNHTHSIADVTGLQVSLDSKATTSSLSGYVTTSSLSTTLSDYATSANLTSGLSGKYNTPVGTTSQYIRGDGTLATFPTIPTVPTNISSFTNDSGYLTNAVLTGYRKVETFLGTSDANGNVTITFANTYTTPPDVQPQIIGGTFNQSVRVVSVSTTGCVVQAAQRNLVTLLSIEVLLGATVNLVGASVTVQVTPRS